MLQVTQIYYLELEVKIHNEILVLKYFPLKFILISATLQLSFLHFLNFLSKTEDGTD